ncbi:hypothetical protein CANCADRAFT_30101, partial [Tortispora caseinolytica NRRL Y-17796]
MRALVYTGNQKYADPVEALCYACILRHKNWDVTAICSSSQVPKDAVVVSDQALATFSAIMDSTQLESTVKTIGHEVHGVSIKRSLCGFPFSICESDAPARALDYKTFVDSLLDLASSLGVRVLEDEIARVTLSPLAVYTKKESHEYDFVFDAGGPLSLLKQLAIHEGMPCTSHTHTTSWSLITTTLTTGKNTNRNIVMKYLHA